MKKLLLTLALASMACLAQYETILGSVTVGSSRPQLNLKPASRVGVGAPSGNCTAGLDYYINSSTGFLYGCPTTNTWALVGSGGGGGSWGSITGTLSAQTDLQSALDGKQSLDADLTAIAALSTTGIVARTAANTYVPRTITGTANQVTVTNGDGVSGAPTLSFPTNMTLPGTTTGTFSGGLTGNVTGNVSGTSGSTTGNAATATALATGRTINGTTFDGTANITVTAAAGTLTGTTLNSSVVTSSLTSVGTIGTGVWQGTAIGATYGGLGQALATEDGIPVGNGTALPLSVLPSCSNTTTSKLLYNSSTNAFSCGTDQTGASGTDPHPVSFSGATTQSTTTAATHGHGTSPMVQCRDSAGVITNSPVSINPVTTNGDVVFGPWSPAFTGTCVINGGGTGPAGPTGPTGPAGSGGIADPGSNGFLDRTALNTVSSRTLTGTANQISITNGGGGGNPVFSIPTSPTLPGTTTGTFSGNLTGAVTGNASTATALATTRAIYGNNFDGTAALTQIIASTFGGTGNGFTKFSGATTSEKTYTLPNSSTTIVTIADTGTVTNTMLAGSIDLTAKVTGILPGANGGSGNGFFAVTGPTTSLKTFTLPNASATILTSNAVVTVAQGGIGVGTLTGIAKGNGTSAFTAAVSADIYGLWSGTCSSSTFLRGDGSCQTPAGSGTITAGVTNVIPKYTASTTIDDSLLSDDGTTLAYTGTGGISAAAFTVTGTMGGQSSWQAGTGNQNALPSNSAGFVAPTTGGTAYLIRFPATITAGIPLFGTPGTVDNVNQSAMTVLSTTGSGDVVRATSATLVTPALGTPSALVCTNCSGTAASLTAGAATVLATARLIGNVSFNGSAAIVPETMTVIDSTDATSSIAMFDSATGSLQAKTDAGLTYNATTGVLTATGFAGPLTGAVTGNASTSTALAADPTDCSSNQPAIGIVAAGTATCMTLTATIVKSTSGVLSAATAGTDYVAPGGALGTPSSGVLTNATGLPTTGLVNNAVDSSKMAVVNTRRVCDMVFGNTNGSALANGDLGPQKGICFIPYAATIVEIDVKADGGTPNIIIGTETGGSVTNVLSSALATAASGARACSKTTAVAGIDGTTCSATLQNTSITAGSYIEAVSGTAGGVAKLMTVHVVYTVN